MAAAPHANGCHLVPLSGPGLVGIVLFLEPGKLMSFLFDCSSVASRLSRRSTGDGRMRLLMENYLGSIFIGLLGVGKTDMKRTERYSERTGISKLTRLNS